MIKKILVLVFISLQFACGGNQDLVQVAESDRPLFGKIKFWEIEQLSDQLYAFRYTFYRNIILIGDDGIIVTDPLTPEAASILNDELKKISDKPIKYVAYSHSHWDHVSGGQVFKDQGATFVAHQQCLQNWLENPSKNVVKPDQVFANQYTIDVGNSALEMYYFGPSHDNCRVVFLTQPDRYIFIADDANPPNGMNMIYGAGLADTYIFNLVPFFKEAESLARKKRARGVIGSHMSFENEPMNLVTGTVGSTRVIKQQRKFYELVIREVRRAMDQGVPPDLIPEYLIKKEALREKIIGFDEQKMKVLYRRITNYLVTGE